MQYEDERRDNPESVTPATEDDDTVTITNAFDDTKEVNVLYDLIAGGVAGSASVIVGHPFDTIKVRLQTSSTSLSSNASGGFFSLFRGMAAPLSTATVVNAIIFAAYGAASRWWDQYVSPPNEELQHDPWKKAFLCGTYAGLCQTLVICPMEHLKCRLQVEPTPGDAAFRGPIDAARAIMRSHGVAGLYRGFGCTLVREVPAFGAYFSVYDAVKDIANKYFDSHGSSSEQHRWMCSAFAGGFSGSVTWIIIYPVDVVKTRIQTAPLDEPRTNMWSLGRSLVAERGWRYMFRGLGVTLVRAFPVNGIIFPVYEFTLTHLTNLDR